MCTSEISELEKLPFPNTVTDGIIPKTKKPRVATSAAYLLMISPLERQRDYDGIQAPSVLTRQRVAAVDRK